MKGVICYPESPANESVETRLDAFHTECPLTPERETELVLLYQAGARAESELSDPNLSSNLRWELKCEAAMGHYALDAMVRAYQHRVLSIARSIQNGQRADLQDLVQDGYEGLLLAFQAFDPSHGHPLSLHCMRWIRQHILAANKSFDSTPRGVNTDQQELREAIKAANDELTADEAQVIVLMFGLNGAGEHSVDGVAAALCLPTDSIIALRDAALSKLRRSPSLQRYSTPFSTTAHASAFGASRSTAGRSKSTEASGERCKANRAEGGRRFNDVRRSSAVA